MIAYIPHTFHSVPVYYARSTTTVRERFIDAYCRYTFNAPTGVHCVSSELQYFDNKRFPVHLDLSLRLRLPRYTNSILPDLHPLFTHTGTDQKPGWQEVPASPRHDLTFLPPPHPCPSCPLSLSHTYMHVHYLPQPSPPHSSLVPRPTSAAFEISEAIREKGLVSTVCACAYIREFQIIPCYLCVP